MEFKITYYGGIPNWNKQIICYLVLNEDEIIFSKSSLFNYQSFNIHINNIEQLRFKSEEERSPQKALNNYLIGRYLFRSNLLGLIGGSVGLKKQENGRFRLFYFNNNQINILTFACSKNASILFNELQLAIRR